MKVYTGTSGFSYKAWKGTFYPRDLADKEMLGFYASQLGAVEINNTFYRMPRESVLADWCDKVSEDFRFVVKASQRLTHRGRLKNVDDTLAFLVQNVRVMQSRLGALLFQLPPNFKRDDERLRDFLARVPSDLPTAWEFRHESWHDEAVRTLLADFGAAACVADQDDAPEPQLHATASFGYLRLRREAYDEAALARWADRIEAAGWNHAFVFFKHEDGARGPACAALLKSLTS